MIPIVSAQETTCLSKAVNLLNEGKVIAYPTEAVYGFGCDPNHSAAVDRIYALKERSPNKGFILISHRWEIVAPWVGSLPAHRMEAILSTWPGPVTWVLPASSLLPQHLKHKDGTIAVRITAHPFAKALCHAFNKPLVSTSANKASEDPCRTAQSIGHRFVTGLDLIVDGPLGSQSCPTEIRLGATGAVLRPGTP